MTQKLKLALGLLVVGALIGVAAGAAYAATSPVTPVVSQATGFDPYSLTAYSTQRVSDDGSINDISILMAPRVPIRVPFRPELRSPFRPNWQP